MKSYLTLIALMGTLNAFAFDIHTGPMLLEDYVSATFCNTYSMQLDCEVKVDGLLARRQGQKTMLSHKEKIVLYPGTCQSVGFYAPVDNTFINVKANSQCSPGPTHEGTIFFY